MSADIEFIFPCSHGQPGQTCYTDNLRKYLLLYCFAKLFYLLDALVKPTIRKYKYFMEIKILYIN